MLLSTRQLLLNLLLRAAPAGWSRPADNNLLRVRLYTTLPDDTGAGGVEATGSGYSAMEFTADNANLTLTSDVVAVAAEIRFPVLTGSIGEVVGWGLTDGADNLLIAQPAGDLPLAAVASAAANTLTRASHGLVNGIPVRVSALDGLPLPGGLSANTTYFVVGADANTLQLAATAGGAAIDLTTDAACYVRRWYGKSYGLDDRPVIPAGLLRVQLSTVR